MHSIAMGRICEAFLILFGGRSATAGKRQYTFRRGESCIRPHCNSSPERVNTRLQGEYKIRPYGLVRVSYFS